MPSEIGDGPILGSQLPNRAPWNGFPRIVLAADESSVKRHPEYEEAKTGDVPAAKRLANQLTGPEVLNAVRALIGDRTPAMVPVHALENQGYNRIPAAFAEYLADKLNLDVEIGIIQSNVVNHTGASGWERMVRPPLFDGTVPPEREYVLVDDFVGQGGTLANLRGYLMHGGGHVLGATTLTGRADSATLALEPRTLVALRDKHGAQIENWWQRVFGYRFDCLTQSEARYLLRVEDADAIRARVIAAGSQEHG